MSICPYLCTYSCPHIHIHSLSSGDKTCSQIAKLEATKLMNSAVGGGDGGIRRIARGGFMTLVRLFLSFRKSHASDSQR